MRIAILAALLAAAVPAVAEDNAVERGLQKAGKALDRGAKATGRALERGANAVSRTGQKVQDKIEEKVSPKKK